jgi:precorrin-6B methylase 1
LFSFHEGAATEKKKELALAVKAGGTVMLLPGPKAFSPKEIAEYLISEGIDKKTKVWLCENLTLTNEHISMATLDSLGSKSESLTIMVIKPNSKGKS